MIISIEGKPALIKSGTSFEFIAENRLFMGRDGYTLTITFPLRDCPENRAIFGHLERIDVVKEKVFYECTIQCKTISLAGSLIVTGVSETEVKCQFAEGRCEQTAIDPMDELYITDLDLGASPMTNPDDITPEEAWATGRTEVCLPWINEAYPTVANNWVTYENGTYKWHPDVRSLSWMPYLIVIAKRICDAIGYTYDFNDWENSRFKNLLCCNVVPASWRQFGFCYAMPQWTVTEFFEKLELFMMCEFTLDHRERSVSMRFSKDVIDEIAPVAIDEVVDQYSVDMSIEDNQDCEYIAAKRLAYKECSHQLWNYYSCDWYMAKNNSIKEYDSLAELISKNKRYDQNKGGTPRVFWGESPWRGSYGVTFFQILYAKDVKTHFCFRCIGTEWLFSSHSRDFYTNVFVLQPINIFGSGIPETDNVSTEEIEFVPACIINTYVSPDDDMGCMLQMSLSSDNSSDESRYDSDGNYLDGVDFDFNTPSQSGPAAAIEAGAKGKSSSYYDVINVAFWDGRVPEIGKSPYPIIDRIGITQDWNAKYFNYHMRLSDSSSSYRALLPQIDPKQKFKFSFLSDSIPNPRAIFHIRGKKFLCEKITATFTENGLSQLLKGEFYPIVED